MVQRAKRGIAAAGTVAIAAAVNVATGMLTQHWAMAWWAAAGVLVVVGGGLQAWLTIGDAGGGGDGGGGEQRVDDVTVGASLNQKMAGPGRQSVTGSRIEHDLNQTQGPETT
ncbi:hypothetical protein [Actinomadura sp. WMMA1423]|uniref:hypothetical protein n=1 Tax=Actinomadura sp. WMMA1423 TaxID=2591108 RepID=UPI001146ACD1|nr:hypothetical protein [Actinomadura sp. WMMA1423]